MREAVQNTLPELHRRRGPDDRRARTARCRCRCGCSSIRASGCADRSSSGRRPGPGRAGRRASPEREDGDAQRGGGGNEDGEIRFVVEMKIDEIIDWIWEELKLPT